VLCAVWLGLHTQSVRHKNVCLPHPTSSLLFSFHFWLLSTFSVALYRMRFFTKHPTHPPCSLTRTNRPCQLGFFSPLTHAYKNQLYRVHAFIHDTLACELDKDDPTMLVLNAAAYAPSSTPGLRGNASPTSPPFLKDCWAQNGFAKPFWAQQGNLCCIVALYAVQLVSISSSHYCTTILCMI
jgi:hypothetical protein